VIASKTDMNSKKKRKIHMRAETKCGNAGVTMPKITQLIWGGRGGSSAPKYMQKKKKKKKEKKKKKKKKKRKKKKKKKRKKRKEGKTN